MIGVWIRVSEYNVGVWIRVWIRVFNTEIPRQNVFFLNSYCGYFIKEIPNGFLCLGNMIQTLGMLLDFRKAKNTRLAARVFLRFSTVSQHHTCLDHVIPTTPTSSFKNLTLSSCMEKKQKQ